MLHRGPHSNVRLQVSPDPRLRPPVEDWPDQTGVKLRLSDAYDVRPVRTWYPTRPGGHALPSMGNRCGRSACVVVLPKTLEILHFLQETEFDSRTPSRSGSDVSSQKAEHCTEASF